MRVCFLLSEYSLHNHIVSDYVRARPDDDVALVKVRLVLKGKSRKETATRILPRLSRRFLAAKVLEAAVVAAVTVLPKLMRRGAVFRRLSWIARRHGLPFHETDNVMAKDTLAFIRAREPDVVVSLFHQIIKRELIAIPKTGIVNVHPGLLPEFKGIQPYFWELSEGFGKAGATLHLIEDESIDTGGVLARTEYATTPGMSVQRNYYETICAASRALPDCLARLHAGDLQPEPQPEGGAYWKWPDSEAFDRLRARGHKVFGWRGLWRILRGT